MKDVSEIFDRRADGMMCVRFLSGDVGVVDERGEVVYRIDRCRHIEFAENDLLKLKFGVTEILSNPTLKEAPTDDESYLRSVFYVDMRSGQMYGSMPKILRFGGFELLYAGGCVCTRTRKCYMRKMDPDLIERIRNGLYLPLSCQVKSADEKINAVLRRHGVLKVCLLKDDDSKVYWVLEEYYQDNSVLVMDEKGQHTYVWMDWRTGKVTRQELGYVRNEAERVMMNLALNDIGRDVIARYLERKDSAWRKAEEERSKELNAMVSVVPFKIGGKWGLKSNGRMVVPPMYRTIHAPVGKYCAVESCLGIWGVIAIDGRVEIEPRYEGVEIMPDGTVELTVFHGKTVIKKLKN